MEKSLNSTMQSCCGATLARIEQPESSTKDDGDTGVPFWAYILGGAVGFVFLVILIVVVVMVVKRKKASVNTGSYYNRETGGKENLGFQK